MINYIQLRKSSAAQKGTKQQRVTKDPKDKRTKSVDSRDEVKVRRQLRIWAPRIELDGAPISWDASLCESQKGQVAYLAEALEQPLFLPRDMDAFRHIRQLDPFMSLKRDLAMVRSVSTRCHQLFICIRI